MEPIKQMSKEEKLEKARELYKTANADQRYVLERLFPELIEFKDKLLELFQIFRWRCKDHILTNGEILEYVDAHIQELIDTMQKPAWSEENELHIRELESLVKQAWATAEHKNDKDTIHKMSDLSFFLKTLKPQNQWKPSDEQMTTLRQVISGCSYDIEPLVEIEEALKENGIDPDSKEADIYREAIYKIYDRLKAQKGK